MRYNTNGFGGVVIYKSTIDANDILTSLDTILDSNDLVYHRHWVGSNPEIDATVYTCEKVFGKGEDDIFDEKKIRFEVNAYDTAKNQFAALKKLNNMLSWVTETNTEGRFLYVCPRFDFDGNNEPTTNTMVMNKFYKALPIPPFKIDDIGNAGGGESMKIKFKPNEYVDSFEAWIPTSLYRLIGKDSNNDDFLLIGKDINGDDFVLIGK